MENLRAPSTLERWLTARPSAPVITYYGDEGVRIELSGATAANAVHKAVNLFAHDMLLDPGDLVWLNLPTCHWQVPVLAVAAWAAGLVLAIGPSAPAGAAATLGTGAGPAIGIPLAVSMHPWGLPLGQATPAGWEDLAAIARIQPDRASLRWPPADLPWLQVEGSGHAESGEQLLRTADDLRAVWGLPDGGRLLSCLPPTSSRGLLACTMVPASAGGAVILTTSEGSAGILRQEGNAVCAFDV